MDGLKTLSVFLILQYLALLACVFGLGLPVAIVRQRLGHRKKGYLPETEDVLIGICLAVATFTAWLAFTHW